MKTLSFLPAGLLSILFSLNSYAQSVITVNGSYTGNQVWDADTVKVEGDIAIAGRLDIRPGTYVEFQGYFEITADSILAMGSIGDSITFTVKDTTSFTQYSLLQGGWKKIQASYYMEFNYCRIMFGKYYNILSITNRCTNYPIRINNSVISNIYSPYFTKSRGSPGDCWGDEAIFRNSLFTKNQFQELSYKNSIIDSCRFIGNSCKISGSIIDSYFGQNKKLIFSGWEYVSLSLRYCIIENNDTLQIKCGGLGLANISSSIFTGNNNTVFNSSWASIDINIVNNTFVYNHIAEDAKALFNLAGDGNDFYNNILYGNYKQSPQVKLISFNYNGKIRPLSGFILFNLIKGGLDEIEYNGITGYNEGNIDVDPLFFDTLHNDFHLTAQSPCINYTGFSNIYMHLTHGSHDLDGNPRIYGICADIGAYEYQGTPDNRPPIIELFSTPKILPGVSSPLTVRFFDPDSGDICSVLNVLSETPEVKADIIASDSASVNINITADSDWQGIGHIQIQVTDNHDHITSYEFPVNVSKVVCGELSSNTVWGGDTVKVECDVTVRNGVTLTIQPGTTIAFGKNCRLIVKGLLLAVGNDSSRITFTSSDTNGYFHDEYLGWGGISNYDVSNPYYSSMAVFRYCDFQYSTANSEYSSTIYWRTTGNYGDSLIVMNCNFYNNHSQSDGGAIFIHSHAIIQNNTFFNNKAEGSGGAIYLDYHSIDIKNCMFFNNYAEYGGAVYCNFEPISNCLFVNNSAKYGGAIAIRGTLKLINNTISENCAELNGGGVYCYDGSISNCILWNNKAGLSGNEIKSEYGSLLVNNSIIKDGINGISGSDILPTNTIYSANPYFKNSSAYDFRLSDSSFAINTGTSDTSGLQLPGTDLDGNPRIADLYVDIGAYEYHTGTFSVWKQPRGITACNGSEAILESNASGGVTGYQWQRNGTGIPMATARILSFDTLSKDDKGEYNCLISTNSGRFSTDTVNVLPLTTAEITDQTQSFGICEKQDTVLSIKVSDPDSMSYEWYFGDVWLGRSDNGSIFLDMVSGEDAGDYYSIASNLCGSDTSSVIGVTVYPLPVISLGKDTTIQTDDPLTLNAGEGFDSYLWSTGAGSQVLPVNTSQTGDYEYWVRVSDSNSCAATDTILITMELPDAMPGYTRVLGLKVFPNPTAGIVYLIPQADMNGEILITVIDAGGRLVHKDKLSSLKSGVGFSIDLSGMENGVYLLMIDQNPIRIIKNSR